MNRPIEKLNRNEREAIRRLREQMKVNHAGASRGGGEVLLAQVSKQLVQAAANGAYIGSQPSGQVSE